MMDESIQSIQFGNGRRGVVVKGADVVAAAVGVLSPEEDRRWESSTGSRRWSLSS